ncbi:dihydroorotate dehydrogenase electron transfer subunit [Lachnospiraceae bacterium SGI.054]|uniref:dihydroorotate dehydrogenase electron transfer subunit n=1 Tax=Mediterraneibacter faecis TaxID=592978 RepID=UPI003F89E47A
MAEILQNERVNEDFYFMKVKEKNQAAMGQFYMLRAWNEYPVLSRPISVFDADPETVSFLYKVVGKGTEIFAELKAGDEITLDGPHGNGFPEVKGKVALVGGGVGIAPLYLTAKTLKKLDPDTTVDIYLGFSGEPILTDRYEQVADKVTVNVGGFVTDDIDPCQYDYIMTCGPEIMMKVLYKKCKDMKAAAPVYVSMENRMACGIGACLVCTCKTSNGNRRACKDGPVMLGNEVFDYE